MHYIELSIKKYTWWILIVYFSCCHFCKGYLQVSIYFVFNICFNNNNNFFLVFQCTVSLVYSYIINFCGLSSSVRFQFFVSSMQVGYFLKIINGIGLWPEKILGLSISLHWKVFYQICLKHPSPWCYNP